MQKINYQFTALEPIHTGSDLNMGTLRTLRRERVIQEKAKVIRSRFTPDQRKLKRMAVAYLLIKLWNKMEDKGRVTIYDEVAAKLISSTSVRSKEDFLNTICQKLEIRQITQKEDGRFDVIDILELFDDEELLQVIRDEHQYIMAVFRKLKDDTVNWDKENGKKKKVTSLTLFNEGTGDLNPLDVLQDQLGEVQLQPFQDTDTHKMYEMVPVISGNSIRGLLRRLVMYDFAILARIEKIEAGLYHRLFTGGTINDSNGFEDLQARQNYIQMCPMIGLFGSAVGNQTIQGELTVGDAKPLCFENGLGRASFHDFVHIQFGTRLDSEKLESTIEVLPEAKPETHQMKYEYEVYATGTPFRHTLACWSDNPLMEAAFARLVNLFKQNAYVCAKSSIGHGHVNLTALPDMDDSLYLQHIEENKEAIKQFFGANG